MTKKLYVTTAIPYVNGRPHIGNAMDYLLADVWARYEKQQGNNVRFQVGTDEHGNKNAAKAKELGLSPQQYADDQYVYFQDLMVKMKVNFTDFIRTTNPAHIKRVQAIWIKLAPHIYKGEYEGWYCDGCEGFVTDREATENGGVCPDHKTPYRRLKEENYYLKISDFKAKIQEAIEADRMKIVPEFRKKEFLALLPEMPDVSISRPKKSLSWGVPVPGDDDQVMYVWLDALANYLTVLGYPDNPEYAEYWPADVQVVGKDIMRFHAGIWPAMLLGLDLSLPKVLLVHGHITVNGEKMSKTVGNVVDPVELIDSYGLDAFRYFFSRHINTCDDGDFTLTEYENAYNNELGNDLGNLVNRVAAMVVKYQSGVVGNVDDGDAEHDMHGYREAFRLFQFSEAINRVWSLVHGANKYIDRVKPWTIAKLAETSPDEKAHLDEVLLHLVGTILQVARMLGPFLPDASEKIIEIFGTGVVKMPESGLFPKIYKASNKTENAA